MEVGGGLGYPASALSNFAPHKFTLDGVECASMEGFLQGLKYKSVEMQANVCTLTGKAAKFKGKKKAWYRTQTLYWQGTPYPRSSAAYQNLIDRAYNAMFEQSESFKKALLASGKDAVYKHSIGKNDAARTVLTISEFCSRLMKLKKKAFDEKVQNNRGT